MERELVKIASDNPAHTGGYYTQFRDAMQPGDAEYFEGQIGTRPDDSDPGIQIDAGDPPAEPIEHEPAHLPVKKRKVKK